MRVEFTASATSLEPRPLVGEAAVSVFSSSLISIVRTDPGKAHDSEAEVARGGRFAVSPGKLATRMPWTIPGWTSPSAITSTVNHSPGLIGTPGSASARVIAGTGQGFEEQASRIVKGYYHQGAAGLTVAVLCLARSL